MPLLPHKRREYLNIPNYLTLGRILVIPVMMILIAKISPERSDRYNLVMGLIASAVFVLAGVSDMLDGYLARKYKINSVFGKYFDSFADKLVILTVMIMLIPVERIPAWMVVLFMAREIAITGLRGIATSEGLVMPADRWGKNKALLQNIALVSLMVHYPLFGVNWAQFGWVILWLALAMALGSAVNYVYQFSKEIKRRYADDTPANSSR